jgi:hypothetical protein
LSHDWFDELRSWQSWSDVMITRRASSRRAGPLRRKLQFFTSYGWSFNNLRIEFLVRVFVSIVDVF